MNDKHFIMTNRLRYYLVHRQQSSRARAQRTREQEYMRARVNESERKQVWGARAKQVTNLKESKSARDIIHLKHLSIKASSKRTMFMHQATTEIPLWSSISSATCAAIVTALCNFCCCQRALAILETVLSGGGVLSLSSSAPSKLLKTSLENMYNLRKSQQKTVNILVPPSQRCHSPRILRKIFVHVHYRVIELLQVKLSITMCPAIKRGESVASLVHWWERVIVREHTHLTGTICN